MVPRDYRDAVQTCGCSTRTAPSPAALRAYLCYFVAWFLVGLELRLVPFVREGLAPPATPPHLPQCAHWGTFPSRGRPWRKVSAAGFAKGFPLRGSWRRRRLMRWSRRRAEVVPPYKQKYAWSRRTAREGGPYIRKRTWSRKTGRISPNAVPAGTFPPISPSK